MDDRRMLDWLEQQVASGQRIELAKGLFGHGVELGMSPPNRAIAGPSLREVVTRAAAAIGEQMEGK